mmetsp:Transcript_26923/g.57066  ORF Transcript_26923/g.57066 Transcript_26923/m.57066 type:complete len:324 (-) Transcript_26923:551-1522(-)
MHLCLQAVRPLQLRGDHVRLLHEWHHDHQLLLEPLHAQLVLPVVLLLGRCLFRLLLQLLDPSLSRLFGPSLALLKLLLELLKLLRVGLGLLLSCGLIAGLGLSTLVLQGLLPLLLSLLHLRLELLLAQLEQGLCLCLRLALRLLRLFCPALEVLGHLATCLELLLGGAKAGLLIELLPGHRVVHLPRMQQLRRLSLRRVHKHEDALAEDDAVAMFQGDAILLAFQRAAVHECGADGLLHDDEDARRAVVGDCGVVLLNAGTRKPHVGPSSAVLARASADARSALLEREAELVCEQLVLVQVGDVRQREVLLLLLSLLSLLPGL